MRSLEPKDKTVMKKQIVDARRPLQNDKENGNGKAKAAKRTKPADEKFVIGNTDTVKRGFLLEFCDFTRKTRSGGRGNAGEEIRLTADRRAQGGCCSRPSLHSLMG